MFSYVLEHKLVLDFRVSHVILKNEQRKAGNEAFPWSCWTLNGGRLNRCSQVFTQSLHICTEPLWTVATLRGQDRSEHDEDEKSFVIGDGENGHAVDP